jgi:hypothetical protein
VSAWTTAAHSQVAPHARLLYATTTDAFADRWRDLHAQLDIFPDGSPPRTPSDEIALEVVLDDDLSDRKLVALRAQASQTDGLLAVLGEERYRAWWSSETFRQPVMSPAVARTGA